MKCRRCDWSDPVLALPSACATEGCPLMQHILQLRRRFLASQSRLAERIEEGQVRAPSLRASPALSPSDAMLAALQRERTTA